MSRDIHYDFWLLMIPSYCEKWIGGACYMSGISICE